MKRSNTDRTRAVCAGLLAAFLFGPALLLQAGEGEEDELSGTWSITISGAGMPAAESGTLDLQLGADGTTVTGVAKDETAGDQTPVSGTFVGGQLALTVDLSAQGGPTATLNATLLPDGTLSGTFNAMGLALSFSGTRTSGGGGSSAAVVTSGLATVAGADSAAIAAAASAQAAAQAAQQAQMRLQRLMQMPVDRRPSAILRAWVKPLKKKKEEQKPAEGAEAAPPPEEMPEEIVVMEEELGEDLPPEIRMQLMQQMAMQNANRPMPNGGAPGGPPDPFAEEVEQLQRDVTLGDWAAVGSYLSGLPADHWKQVHLKLLQMLPLPPQNQQVRDPSGMFLMEKNVVSPKDVLGLSEAAPVGTDAQVIQMLGILVRETEAQGHQLEPLIAAWKQGTKHLGGEDPVRRKSAVEVLLAAGKAGLAAPFVPERKKAEEEGDAKALDLLARYYLALHAQEKDKLELLESAWGVNLRLLSCEKVEDPLKYVALERAIQLVPRVKDELGQTWLRQAFDKEVERGRDVLALTGAVAGSTRVMHGRDAKSRLAALRLQHVAASSLIKLVPERATEWADKLELLLRNWLAEVEISVADQALSRQLAQLRRDRWGNFYYYEDQEMIQRQQEQQRRAQPIGALDLLELKPDEAWIALTSESLRPRLISHFARLHLIQKETDKAFPLIERLAASRPKEARELAQDTLQLWIEDHDPNADQRNRGSYIFMWGYEERADGIPLTRSKQERNLADLAQIIARLKQLPIEPIDEKVLAQAFVRAHGSAEVYRLEAVEKVFGSVGALDPATLYGLIQTMRGNLAQHWRDPKVQKAAKTKRTQPEIEAEVVRGYEVALRLADDGLVKHDRWELHLARACVLHDLNEYVRRELKQSPEYAAHRMTALQCFARAAASYVARLPQLKEEEERLDPFETWFHASLGACDLGRLTPEHRPDLSQAMLIKAALEKLPGEPGERARTQFATNLFTRLSAVNAALKFNYLKAGFMIVGDHKDAREARKVFDYYKDLVTEIQLVTHLDGSDRVGNGKPFGLFVDIRHTEHIERESGGFSKYLTNQNQGSYFYWNYGRPLEDYRDKFEEATKKALEERFEVLSITFQDPSIKSRPDPEQGWRVTPYAYVLLKTRGPEVDKLPPLELNLDFLDTSGYAVLPVGSAPIPVDAREAQGAPRPLDKLELVQTLDERRAAEGTLVLEVKATARGLVPELEQVLEPVPAGFQVESVEDSGVSVSKCDAETPIVAPVSDRLWTLKLRGKQGQSRLPAAFTFPAARQKTEKVTYQRYDDEDLAQVGREVPLVARYGTTSARWPYVLAFATLLGLGAWAARRSGTGATGPAPKRFTLPARLTPFTVQSLLARIRREAPLPAEAQQELDKTLAELDARYFARAGAPAPAANGGNGHAGNGDLEAIARRWVDKAG